MQVSRRKLLSTGLGLGALAMAASFTRLGPWRYPNTLKQIDRSAAGLGTKVHITALHADVAAAHRAIDAGFAALDRVEDVLSIYRPTSDVSRLNREGALDDPHDDLRAVLGEALAMSRRTGGAFDVSVQPLWLVYAAAQKQARLPNPREIEAARRLVDWRKIDVTSNRITLRRPGMAVTFNGIAQGFAADRVRQILASHGIEHALIDVGELAPLGANEGKPWRAGIQHPRVEDAYVAIASLDRRCLATSGDYATSFTADRTAHHILDPSTGRSPREFASVSIAADTAMRADALSTAVFVLGFEKGVDLVRNTAGADAFFVFKDGRTFATDGFPVVDALIADG